MIVTNNDLNRYETVITHCQNRTKEFEDKLKDVRKEFSAVKGLTRFKLEIQRDIKNLQIKLSNFKVGHHK